MLISAEFLCREPAISVLNATNSIDREFSAFCTRIEKALVIRLGFRNRQDAIDELKQMLAARENLLDAPGLGVCERAHFQQLRETEHMIHWRAQLVAGAREKFSLG